MYQLVFGMHANLTIDSADDTGVNPEVVRGDEQHAQRQLKAGERVLTQVRREKNDLQDANTRLGVELKDVRAQLADFVKENRRLQRGIFSMCSNEPLYSSAKNATHPVRFDAKTYVRNDFKYLPDIVSDTRKPGFTTEVARNFYVSDSFKDTILQDIKKSRLGTRGRYVYSCVNFIMLKMMVENLMRSPMDQLLRDDFYSGLGAWHTTYNPLKRMDTLQIVPTEQDGFVRRQLLRGYVHDEAAAFQGGVSGNAGLFSNANDLAKVLQLMLNQGTYGGERYLSLETSRLFTQSKSPTCRRGLGFDKPVIGNPKASPCGALAPASVYGHTGFTGTCFWVDPDNQLIYIFLSNRVNPSRANNKLGSLDIRTRIQDAIYKAIDRKSQKDS